MRGLQPRVTLAEQPESDGLGQWVARTTSGNCETFHCQIDATRASAAAAELMLELKAVCNLKRLWASELAAAAVARSSRMGEVKSDLSPIPENLLPHLMHQAVDL
jgi:hypothetical protein